MANQRNEQARDENLFQLSQKKIFHCKLHIEALLLAAHLQKHCTLFSLICNCGFLARVGLVRLGAGKFKR